MINIDLFNKRKIKKLEDKIFSLERDLVKEKNNLETYKEIANNSNARTLLLEENRTLIKWIQRILTEFGTTEVRDRNRVRIPVYKKIEPIINGNMYCSTKKTIIIPEIVIQEIK